MGAISPAIIVTLGNAKGGVGKSTIAVNLAIGLARSGVTTATIDLDGRQRTLTRWLDRRSETSIHGGTALVIPEHQAIVPAVFDSVSLNEERDFAALAAAVERLDAAADVIIIDTPSGESYLARVAVSLCDILVTPVQDSIVDIDALCEPSGGQRPYCALVAEAREARGAVGDSGIDWIVARSRRPVMKAQGPGAGDGLNRLAEQLGFRLVAGPGERAVYRDLFAKGLSVFDAAGDAQHHGAVGARVGAREEIAALIAALYLPFALPGPHVEAGLHAGRR